MAVGTHEQFQAKFARGNRADKWAENSLKRAIPLNFTNGQRAGRVWALTTTMRNLYMRNFESSLIEAILAGIAHI
jgi:hypothetical protein